VSVLIPWYTAIKKKRGYQIETLPVPIIPWTGHMTLKGRTKDTNHSQDRNKALQNGSLKVILMNRGQAANKCRER
jgi:hypothetical protein